MLLGFTRLNPARSQVHTLCCPPLIIVTNRKVNSRLQQNRDVSYSHMRILSFSTLGLVLAITKQSLEVDMVPCAMIRNEVVW
ncbi:hypothetical protein BDR05DRAFT_965742 [Suillus weaverae]|nr:hypothetical protein BDR05DRAFT_965742 [Suillus weaverae]